MERRKLRPDSFKMNAVRRLMARGSKTIAEISKELGISHRLLHRSRERFESELTRGVQPTNNSGEQALRHAVIIRKISYDAQALRRSHRGGEVSR